MHFSSTASALVAVLASTAIRSALAVSHLSTTTTTTFDPTQQVADPDGLQIRDIGKVMVASSAANRLEARADVDTFIHGASGPGTQITMMASGPRAETAHSEFGTSRLEARAATDCVPDPAFHPSPITRRSERVKTSRLWVRSRPGPQRVFRTTGKAPAKPGRSRTFRTVTVTQAEKEAALLLPDIPEVAEYMDNRAKYYQGLDPAAAQATGYSAEDLYNLKQYGITGWTSIGKQKQDYKKAGITKFTTACAIPHTPSSRPHASGSRRHASGKSSGSRPARPHRKSHHRHSSDPAGKGKGPMH